MIDFVIGKFIDFVDYDDISKWDCKLMKYTNAYYIKREELLVK